MNIRARQLLEEAHQAYLLSVEYQRRGYELEQMANHMLVGERMAIGIPISVMPMPTEPAEALSERPDPRPAP